MKEIVVIAPPDASPGFACCGADQHAVVISEAGEALSRVPDNPSVKVVILDERLLAEIDEESLRGIERRWPGVLVVLPAPGRPAQEEDYALRLIRRAIGYHVRVRT